MRRIPLRNLPDPQLAPGAPRELVDANTLRWADIVRQVVRRPLDQQKGADIEEMRRGIRILDALDRNAQVLELEDADYEHLKEKVAAMPWGLVDRRILEFCDAVNNATDQLAPVERRDGVTAATV